MSPLYSGQKQLNIYSSALLHCIVVSQKYVTIPSMLQGNLLKHSKISKKYGLVVLSLQILKVPTLAEESHSFQHDCFHSGS